jgi:hypothetical protein
MGYQISKDLMGIGSGVFGADLAEGWAAVASALGSASALDKQLDHCGAAQRTREARRHVVLQIQPVQPLRLLPPAGRCERRLGRALALVSG